MSSSPSFTLSLSFLSPLHPLFSCRPTEVVVLCYGRSRSATASIGQLLGRPGAHSTAVHWRHSSTTPSPCSNPRIFHKLLVRSDDIASVSLRVSIIRTVVTTDCHGAISTHGATSAPLVVIACLPDALPGLIEVVNELPLIVLTSNDSLLGSSHARSKQSLAGTCMLRRSVLVLCQASQPLNHVWSTLIGSSVNRLVLMILCVEQERLQPK